MSENVQPCVVVTETKNIFEKLLKRISTFENNSRVGTNVGGLEVGVGAKVGGLCVVPTVVGAKVPPGSVIKGKYDV